jgi:hypothetical protein
VFFQAPVLASAKAVLLLKKFSSARSQHGVTPASLCSRAVHKPAANFASISEVTDIKFIYFPAGMLLALLEPLFKGLQRRAIKIS